jgi:putative transposase
MARLARVVVPDVPHHVTQRGNRSQRTFFSDDDYAYYLGLMAESCAEQGVVCLAWCLMPNHVHLLLTPSDTDGLARAVSEVHRRYTRHVNGREGWSGFLWQGRFASCPMDEPHLLMAARYVELNPVKAGLAARPEDWRWSSARAHLAGNDDELATVGPLLDLVPDWRAHLDGGRGDGGAADIERHLRTGRPLGAAAFVERIEGALGRTLKPAKRGPKPKDPVN